jgi:hypothetical protein
MPNIHVIIAASSSLPPELQSKKPAASSIDNDGAGTTRLDWQPINRKR